MHSVKSANDLWALGIVVRNDCDWSGSVKALFFFAAISCFVFQFSVSRADETKNIKYAGGPVIYRPNVRMILWSGATPLSPLTEALPSFYRSLLRSNYFDRLKPYQLGSASYGGGSVLKTKVIRPTSSAKSEMTEDEFQMELVRQIDAGALPKPKANEIWSIHIPVGLDVTLAGERVGGGVDTFHVCKDYLAEHNGFRLKDKHKTPVIYLLIPECLGKGGKAPDLDFFTDSASHELIEAMTDPLPITEPAWVGPDAVGYVHFPDEISDYCADGNSDGTLTTPLHTYAVQGYWDIEKNECAKENWVSAF